MTLIALLTACGGDLFFLEDAHNYRFDSELTLATVDVKDEVDLTLDWCGITEDFLGVPLDPTDVTRVEISSWSMTPAQLQASLVATVIPQFNLQGQATVDVDEVCTTTVEQMSFLGTPVIASQYMVAGDHTYLVTLYVGQTARMAQLFVPTPESDSTVVTLGNASALVDLDVILDAGEPIAAPVTVDWSSLTTDGAGYPIALNKLTELWVMRFDEDLDTLAADFARLDLMSDDTTTWNTDGLLDQSLTRSGSALFEDPGTWLLAMRCGSCTNPAPPFLTVVEIE